MLSRPRPPLAARSPQCCSRRPWSPTAALSGVTSRAALIWSAPAEVRVVLRAAVRLRVPAVGSIASPERSGIQQMTEVSPQLQQALEDNSDMIEVMQVANELLDLCRLTQVSLIQARVQQV